MKEEGCDNSSVFWSILVHFTICMRHANSVCIKVILQKAIQIVETLFVYFNKSEHDLIWTVCIIFLI